MDNTAKKMYKDLETYTFTINPSDKYQYFNKVDRLRKAAKAAASYLGYLNYAEYELYPEISKKGRIHWHGYITVLHAAPFQLYDIPSIRDKVIYEIDSLTNPTVWQAYIEKDKIQMIKYTNSINIKYKLTNKLIDKSSPILEAFHRQD